VKQQLLAKPCPVCSEAGERRAVERLPGGGVLVMCAHEDGRMCKWVEVTDLDDFAKPRRKRNTSPVITCPKCKKKGNVNSFINSQAKPEEQEFSLRYYVRHEQLAGGWGKRKNKTKKVRRCYVDNPIERSEILKMLGRYIADPPKAQEAGE
jgi:hypothetical protein